MSLFMRNLPKNRNCPAAQQRARAAGSHMEPTAEIPLPPAAKKSLRRRTAVRSGFLLIEVLVAGAILGIVLIVLSVAVARCVHGLSVAENYRTASQVLDERLAFFDQGNEVRQGVWDGTVERDGRQFAWKHELTPTDDPRFFKERIEVSWKQADGIREETREAYRWKSE